jgi:uncharacterized damage-inducible protein DinB
METRELLDLLEHMQWADATVWTAVTACSAANSDGRMKDVLHHLHSVQWAYLQIWRGDELDMPDVSTFADLAAIRSWCHEYYQQLRAYWSTVKPEQFEREVVFPWADRLVERWGAARPVTFGESVLQACSHSAYHRGQVNMRLRDLGGEPPLVDYVAWIWVERPEPEWEIET